MMKYDEVLGKCLESGWNKFDPHMFISTSLDVYSVQHDALADGQSEVATGSTLTKSLVGTTLNSESTSQIHGHRTNPLRLHVAGKVNQIRYVSGASPSPTLDGLYVSQLQGSECTLRAHEKSAGCYQSPRSHCWTIKTLKRIETLGVYNTNGQDTSATSGFPMKRLNFELLYPKSGMDPR